MLPSFPKHWVSLPATTMTCLLFSLPLVAADADDAWRQVGLSFQAFTYAPASDGTYTTFNNKCASTLKTFEGCFDGLSRAFEHGSSPLVLIPTSYQSALAAVQSQVSQSFGAIVAVTPPNFARPTLSDRRQASLSFQRGRQQAISELFTKLHDQGTNLDFTPLIIHIRDHIIGKDAAQESLVTGHALDSAVKRWQDPHSFFMPQVTMDQRQQAETSYAGIGVDLLLVDDGVLVEKTNRDAVAARAGVRVNDLITHIDGQALKGLSLARVSALIRGTAGSSVTLSIRRGDTTISLTMQRQTIVQKNVNFRLLSTTPAQVAYVQVKSFGPPSTSDDFQAILDNLRTQKPDALIVDLRDNSGGLLNNVFFMAEPFLDQWDDIYTLVDIRFRYRNLMSSRTHIETDVPLFILVNGYSASASEVFAGTLQESKRAFVLGSQTAGKGTGQESLTEKYKLPNVLYYESTKQFLLPSGSTTQIYGITPDIEVLDSPYTTKDQVPGLREADFDNALPPMGPAPLPPDVPESAALKRCADTAATAKQAYDQAQAAGTYVDYPLEYTRSIIACAMASGTLRQPKEKHDGL